MSTATAGKVLLIPKGEYDATTQYKVLDWVLYQGRPYVAKQTTTGNAPIYAPTPQNPDAYWQLMLDFPTLVDNVPTENSQNLVYSGGVYDATASKMEKDGSNANVVKFGDSSGQFAYANTISKDAGDNQTVTMTYSVSAYHNSVDDYVAPFKAHIADENVYYQVVEDGRYVKKYVILDTVSVSGSDITVTAHLKVDDSAAISITDKGLYGKNYVNGEYAQIIGANNAIQGDGNEIVGSGNNIVSSKNLVSGDRNVILDSSQNGRCNFVAGLDNTLSGTVLKGSVALGRELLVGNTAQMAVGYRNNNKSDTTFEVGSGVAGGTRKNAFEVYSSGHISMNDGTDKYKFAKSGGEDGFYDGSNNFHSFKPYKEFIKNSVVLSTSADKTVTFSDAAITADSTIEPFTSVWGIIPKNVVASAGSCTVTIPKQSAAQTIKVKIRVS